MGSRRESLGLPDQQEQTLAWACDYASLTRAQAGALLLFSRGMTIPGIAREMGLSRRKVTESLHKGERHLREAFAAWIERRLSRRRAVIACFANRFRTGKAPPPVLGPCPGGWQEIPLSARPHGMVAEDLIEDLCDFLRFLTEHLEPQRAPGRR